MRCCRDRSCGMIRRVPTFSLAAKRAALEAQQVKTLARILAETDPAAIRWPEGSPGATAGGDSRRLRGIPAIGRGCSGAVAGSDPLRALLAKERPQRRRLEVAQVVRCGTCGESFTLSARNIRAARAASRKVR